MVGDLIFVFVICVLVTAWKETRDDENKVKLWQ